MRATENLSGDRGRVYKPPVGGNLGGYVEGCPEIPQEAADRAMRAVAARAQGVDDTRFLLETRGLIEPSQPRRRPRKGVPA